MKTCSACHETKPLDAFAVSKKAKDGRHPYCKVCASAKARAAYAARGRESWLNDKRCTWCQTLKPRTEFGRTEAGKVRPRCLACEAEIAQQTAAGLKRCNVCREWLPKSSFYAGHLDREHVGCMNCTRAWHRKDAHKQTRRAYHLMKEYGITVEQYLQLVEKQGGKCPVCKEPFEPDNLSYPVDHVHGGPQKGRIRAITHSHCNRYVLWTHEDSAQLRAAADLIDNPLTDWYVPGVPSSELRWQKYPKKGSK